MNINSYLPRYVYDVQRARKRAGFFSPSGYPLSELDRLCDSGRGFSDRVPKGGFTFSDVSSSPAEVVRFDLPRGEVSFLCRKVVQATLAVIK